MTTMSMPRQLANDQPVLYLGTRMRDALLANETAFWDENIERIASIGGTVGDIGAHIDRG
jgi:hypothetical protein